MYKSPLVNGLGPLGSQSNTHRIVFLQLIITTKHNI